MTESAQFDRAAHFYDETRGFPPGVAPQVARMLVDLGPLDAESRLLEIGIGTGRIAFPLIEHVASIAGVDLSPGMLAQLNKNRRGEAIYVAQGDAARLPFPDDAFDSAVVVHVLHLIPSWRTAIDELARVLRPDACLLLGWGTLGQKWVRKQMRARSPAKREEFRGAVRREIFERLIDLGWREGASDVIDFAVTHPPRLLIERVRNRIWSNTWDCAQEELDAEIEILEDILAEHYDDLDRPADFDSDFWAWAFYPPK